MLRKAITAARLTFPSISFPSDRRLSQALHLLHCSTLTGNLGTGCRHRGCGAVHCQRSSAMPAKSQAQQKAAGAALSAKRGDTPKSKLRGASKQMAESMSEKELDKMASTKRKGKPARAAKTK